MTLRIVWQSLALLTWDIYLQFERTFRKDLKTEKKSEISLSTQKISSLES